MAVPVLPRLLEPLRGCPLHPSEQILLACQIATWTFLADNACLPTDLMPDPELLSGDRLANVFGRLQQLDVLRGNGDAFLVQTSTLANVPDQTIEWVLRESQASVRQGLIGPDLPMEALIHAQGYGQTGTLALSQELLGLLVGLACVQAGDGVYTPFDNTLQVSLAIAKTGARPRAELLQSSQLAYLANLLAGQPVAIAVGDPLRQPGYTDGTKLRQFTQSISFPPLGGKYPLELVERDIYRRFPERTSAGNVLAVRQILAQTSGKAVILTANHLLFGTSAERPMREDLVEREILRAVIALPPALLFGSAIPLSILVLDQQRSAPETGVMFIDGNDTRFHKRDGKGRTTLSGWQELLNAGLTGDDPAVVHVSREEIRANDYQLMVARYARSGAIDAVEAALRQGEVRALEDLVEFIRPAPIIPSASETEDGIEVLEVGAGDLSEHDYVRRPSKTVRLPLLKNRLHPLDILIIVKGSVGKVGLIPPGLTENWVASQTCLVLRLARDNQRPAQHSPQSLFLYLRSPLGKACLQRIFSGAAVPLIQLRELRKLPVLSPTVQQAREMDRVFDDMVGIQREIDRLRGRQAALGHECWPLVQEVQLEKDEAR